MDGRKGRPAFGSKEKESQERKAIEKATDHLKRARSLVEGAKAAHFGSERAGGFSDRSRSASTGGRVNNKRSSSGGHGLQQNSAKIGPAHFTGDVRKVTSRVKILDRIGSVSTDYTPSGISNRFEMNMPMPTIDLSERAINHSRYGTGCCVVGSEYLLSAAAIPLERGAIMEAIPFNPRYWGGTRLQVMSQLWNRYLVKNMVLEFVPITNATVSGALMMYPDYDPESTPSYLTGDASIRRAMAYQNCVQFQVFSYARSVFHNSDMTEAYFLEPRVGEARLTNQGIWYLLAASDLTPPAEEDEIVYGNLIVHYEVDFFLRALATPGESISAGTYATKLTLVPQTWTQTTNIFTSGDYVFGHSIILGNSGTQSGALADIIPIPGFAVADFGPAGTMGYCTLYDVAVSALFDWYVYGEEVAISFASQPGFWFKMVSFEVMEADFSEATNVLWIVLFPDLNSCMQYNSQQACTVTVDGTSPSINHIVGVEQSPLTYATSTNVLLGGIASALTGFTWTTFPDVSSFD